MRSIAFAAVFVGAALLSLATGSVGHAANVTSFKPASLVSALQDAGYRAKLVKDDVGDPAIETAAGGNEVKLAFFGCQNGKSCDYIEFISVWRCDGEIKRCMNTSDKWNKSENFASSVVVNDTIALYHYVLFDEAGLSEGLFVRHMEMFSGDMARLMTLFGATK